MQLAILTAILAALAASETEGGPVANLAWRLVLVGVAPLVAPLTALAFGRRFVAATKGDNEAADDHTSRLLAVVFALWLGAVALTLFVAQWPRIVTSNWQLASLPLVDELLILAPVIGSLLLVWAALYRLERIAQVARCRARNLQPPPGQLTSYLWIRTRHYLGLVLLPPLIIITLFETLAALGIAVGNLDSAWWLMLPLLLTMLVLMPLAVRRIWPTTPLGAGALREALDAICRGRNCHVRDILVWRTGGTMANAAVVGLSRRLRYVLLTDALLEDLTPREVAAVVRHEVAHLRRWHLPLRLALLALPLVAWLAIKRVWPEVESLSRWLTVPGTTAQIFSAIAPPLAMLLYALIVVGRYSRALEHDADLDACLNDNGRFDQNLAADFRHALIAVCGGSRTDFLTEWLHPSLTARLNFLQRAANDTACTTAFRQRLSWLATAIGALYVLTLALLAF
jgi:STE24 endopeptidase